MGSVEEKALRGEEEREPQVMAEEWRTVRARTDCDCGEN